MTDEEFIISFKIYYMYTVLIDCGSEFKYLEIRMFTEKFKTLFYTNRSNYFNIMNDDLRCYRHFYY